jgi:biopolymer transport protein ExbD
MAFSVNHGNGGFTPRRGRRFSGLSPNSDINVVPLVDVVLVLLIIFMITANVMEFGLDIQVPEVIQVKTTMQDCPVVSLTKTGNSYLNGRLISLQSLKDAIHTRFHSAKAVCVQADKETPWDPIAQVVATLGEAKFEVKMVTKPVDLSHRH